MDSRSVEQWLTGSIILDNNGFVTATSALWGYQLTVGVATSVSLVLLAVDPAVSTTGYTPVSYEVLEVDCRIFDITQYSNVFATNDSLGVMTSVNQNPFSIVVPTGGITSITGAGTPTTLAWTSSLNIPALVNVNIQGNSGQKIGNFDMQPNVNYVSVQTVMSLYQSQGDSVNGFYVADPSNPNKLTKHVLDLVPDAYMAPMPFQETPFLRREYRLKASCPCVLGPGSGLVATIAVDASVGGALTYAVYSRVRVRAS